MFWATSSSSAAAFAEQQYSRYFECSRDKIMMMMRDMMTMMEEGMRLITDTCEKLQHL